MNAVPRERVEELRAIVRYQGTLRLSIISEQVSGEIETALTRLLALEDALREAGPFIVKHYTADGRPIIKGNGFDGLEIGEDREEAQEFVDWINARITALAALGGGK